MFLFLNLNKEFLTELYDFLKYLNIIKEY